MITTRRSENGNYQSFSDRNGSDVAVLERRITEENSFDVAEEYKVETPEQARERMQRNLDKLLNYDRYSDVQEATVITENVVKEVAVSDEDIRPTSTTMQFGDGEVEKIYNEIPSEDRAEKIYKLNSKGKFAVVLYALAVTVIMALIIINTSVLSALSRESMQKQSTLDQIVNEYSTVNSEIEEKTSDEYVSRLAEGEYGMIKR
jgi:hypothetical protein